MQRISKSVVDRAKPKAGDYLIWDGKLEGFGVRIYESGRKTYVIQYRIEGRQRRLTLGVHGKLTPANARRKAEVAFGRIADGEDPAVSGSNMKSMTTVGEFCSLYLVEGCKKKRPSTIATDQGRIERHIKPLLGNKPLRSVTAADVERFIYDVADGKTAADVKTKKRGRARVTGGRGAANRTVGLLGGIFSFAVKKGLCEKNPVTNVERFPERKMDRVLSVSELRELNRALVNATKSGVTRRC